MDAPRYLDNVEVLVVNLDGTLLRSNMLHESFWSAFGRDWRSPVLSVGALLRGRACLKRYLADAAHVDVSTLPYDQQVIAYIEAWRSMGGATALVTASDQRFAQAVADQLGLFDDVHGSDGHRNLKGAEKRTLLERRFGQGRFAYMGDAPADLPVWQSAAQAITVNASAALRRKAEGVCDHVEHLATAAVSHRAYIKALRPHQWLKNILVFLPMLAAHQIDGATLLTSLLAFVCFNLVASSVYVLNDLLDLAADRSHPRKRHRPFASGRLPISHGVWMAMGLIALGALLSVFAGWYFACIMAGYYVLTAAYSLHLKRRIVIDICVLAGLYTLRIIAGGVATGIALSVWLLAFALFFFLALAAVKRQAELIDGAGRGKEYASGRGYQADDLPIISMIAIGAGYVSVLVMALYVNSEIVVALYAHPQMLWGVCLLLLYWLTHMVMVTHRGQMHDDPIVYAVKDPISRACLVIMSAAVFGGMLV